MQTERKEGAIFFAKTPICSTDPSEWRWPKDTLDHALEILHPEEELYMHFMGSVKPKSTFSPFKYSEGKLPDIGRGHGGMVYVNWNFGLKQFPDLSIDITFHSKPMGPAAVYLQLYDFPIGNTGQYFGFQYSEQAGGKMLKKFIWSRWGTRDTKNAWVPKEGNIESAGYEGDFIGIRYPFTWDQGTYTVNLTMRETDNLGTWYEMRIYDHKKKNWTIVGRLRFPLVNNEPPFIKNGGGSWCEVFRGTKSSNDIHPFHLSYGGIYTCGRNIAAKKISVIYNDSAPNIDVSIDPDGRRVHVQYGGKTRRRTPAGEYLLRKETGNAEQDKNNNQEKNKDPNL